MQKCRENSARWHRSLAFVHFFRTREHSRSQCFPKSTRFYRFLPEPVKRYSHLIWKTYSQPPPLHLPSLQPFSTLPPVRTSDFDYHLPDRLIAQHPVPQRDQSRLLLL